VVSIRKCHEEDYDVNSEDNILDDGLLVALLQPLFNELFRQCQDSVWWSSAK
jgi:hypothetical protein